MNWGYFICFVSMAALLGLVPLNVMFFSNLVFDPNHMWDCWARPSAMMEAGQVVWIAGSMWFSYRVWPFDGDDTKEG